MSLLKSIKGVFSDIKALLIGKPTRAAIREAKIQQLLVKQRLEILELREKQEQQAKIIKKQQAQIEISKIFKEHKKKEEKRKPEFPEEIFEEAGY